MFFAMEGNFMKQNTLNIITRKLGFRYPVCKSPNAMSPLDCCLQFSPAQLYSNPGRDTRIH